MTNLLLALLALFIYLCIIFAIALARKDNSIVDVAYGWGFVLIGLFTLIVGDFSVAGLLVTFLATIWAARLSIRIFIRNEGKPEDFRYKAMREKWGKSVAINSFFQIFMLQGIVIFIVAFPVSLLNIYGNGVGVSLIGFLGLLIWLKGFFFESVGDYQLEKFLKNPANKGKIMDKGLWRYTRHPNYYGESLMWWGLAVIASSSLYAAGTGYFAVLPFLGPLLITFLLLKVSGVPMLEAHFAGKPEWESYKAKTSVFIPWFPRK